MFGWEFPPFNQGGLGTACEGLVKGLTDKGVEVILVLPVLLESTITNCKIVSPNYRIIRISSSLRAYHTPESYYKEYNNSRFNKLYGENLISEVLRYAESLTEIVLEEEFDIIHAHDWLTYKAGLNAKRLSGKPLVVHMHATEFDRTGGYSINQTVYEIEKEGMMQADNVIAVSNFTKNKIVDNYNIDPNKINVIHNGVKFTDTTEIKIFHKPRSTVLFLGRLTMQKGPDHFIHAAKKVLEYCPDATFIIAGNGDMEGRLVEQVAAWNLADKILFTGWLRGKDIDRADLMADLYVMPSVSEPFGITPLEAMRNNVPVIISKQSGVSEIIKHCIKVDFWDINDTASKIISILEHQELKKELSFNGKSEVLNLGWDIPAEKCFEVYKSLVKIAAVKW